MNRLPLLRVRPTHAAAACIGVLLAAGTVHAQTATSLVAGASVFSLRETESTPTDYSPIVRLAGGVNVAFAMRGGLFVRPGIYYAIRGSSFDGEIPSSSGGSAVPVEAVSEIAVIELPIEVGLNIPVRGSLQPRVFAGPVLARVVDSSIRYRALDSDGDWASESDSSVEKNDLGLGFGAEVGFPVGGQTVVTGFRGVVGFSNAVKPDPARESTPSRYHTGVLLYAGIVL